ncbi:SpoIIIAH-like family protein [Paenibacillus anaericanus]|uniref:SpoIIIAH-like family protein n=1 Tax=Paenibacillus anaericanus TaxID=170367 RepID=A0A3S1DUN6_9BACL|nr:SpoIIIAH-like family protein [Paenibacillus anaericanus]RUT47764.1 SpoIIIAH-like family protein [Paenibacillus anaericanus]
MKSKRQTVWLVSMLSLMVVLSAYYLFFTEDSGSTTPPSADGAQVTTMDSGTSNGDDVVLSEVLTGDDANNLTTDATDEVVTEDIATPEGTTVDTPAEETTKSDSELGTTEKGTTTTETGTTDADVLKQLESEGLTGADTLTAYQLERNENNIKKQDELLQAISDDKKTLDEAAMAQQQLGALEEKEAKITDIEERLQQQYANAVVTEDNDKYKVVVVSEKLGAKEAVGIMDLVIKELGVSQDKVSVQYVTE